MKIKRFIDCNVPVTTCNLRCHYCYITQQRKFSDALPVFKYTPEHKAPFYAEMRNRVEKDGSEWLTPRMKAFLSTKLKESNKEYAHELFVKNCLESLFSIKNEQRDGRECKIVRILGVKIRHNITPPEILINRTIFDVWRAFWRFAGFENYCLSRVQKIVLNAYVVMPYKYGC